MIQKISVSQTALEDDKRYVAPFIAITVEIIVKAKVLIKKGSRITYEEIQGALGISSGSVNNSLHGHLCV